MSNNTDLALTLEAWADIVLKNWLQKIMKMHIIDTMSLAKSLEHHVYLNSNGNPERVEFAFMYYGRFVDMGVGEGKVQNGSVKNRSAEKGFKERIARKWYSPVFYSEVMKLQNILAEKYGLKAAQTIAESIDVKANNK
jgi:hypothetical protein